MHRSNFRAKYKCQMTSNCFHQRQEIAHMPCMHDDKVALQLPTFIWIGYKTMYIMSVNTCSISISHLSRHVLEGIPTLPLVDLLVHKNIHMYYVVCVPVHVHVDLDLARVLVLLMGQDDGSAALGALALPYPESHPKLPSEIESSKSQIAPDR